MKSLYRWAELTWEEIGALAGPDAVVVIPVGSVEQHGPHLPVGTDARIVSAVADAAARRVAERVPVLLVPTVEIACSEHHMEFPGSLTLTEETFVQVATEIGMSIVRHGFRRLLFLNGHGGNTAPLRVVVNRIRHRTDGSVLSVTANYWDLIREEVQALRRSKPGGISHAGEFETSAVMALDETLVLSDKRVKFLPKWTNGYFMPGWYTPSAVTPGFHLKDITASGVVGDPTVATKESGERFLEVAGRAVGAFVEAFAAWEWDRLYDNTEG